MTETNLVGTFIQDAIADTVEPPTIEFLGSDNPAFAAQMKSNLRYLTNDANGKKYRLVKMVFQEWPNGSR